MKYDNVVCKKNYRWKFDYLLSATTKLCYESVQRIIRLKIGVKNVLRLIEYGLEDM